MTQEIATQESFQDKMFKRIRDSMGDLMSNDDLKKIVDSAMEKAFFEKRVDRSGYHTKEEPPYFVELIKNEMSKKVELAAKEYLETHQEEVKKAIDEMLGKSFFGIVVSYLDAKAAGPMYMLREQLSNSGFLK